jgi:hypothetical protein
MRLRNTVLLAGTGVLLCWGVLLAQKPFQEHPGIEYSDFQLPKDYQKPAEWTRARLMYPDILGWPNRRMTFQDGRDFPGYWTMDYPRSDRHLLEGIRRLTRIDARSVEQSVELDNTDDIFNWPLLYAVEVGHWDLPDDQAAKLREYLNRGGFLMVDDFHGSNALDHDQGINEWENFTRGMAKVFPDRRIIDLPDDDPIFHTVYNVSDRIQIPGYTAWTEDHQTYEKGPTGMTPHWRAIRDEKGRVVVAICHNMDLGDAWEHADNPEYPLKFTALAYNIAVNYFIYDLSH